MRVQVVRMFDPTTLTTSAAVLYTTPSGPGSLVLGRTRIRFTNIDGAAHQVTAYAIPSGGAVGNGTKFLNAENVLPNAHFDVDVPQLGISATIQALAEAGGVIVAHSMDGVLFT